MPEGVNLGSAYGAIVIDASGVRKGILEAQSAFKSGIDGIGGMVKNFSGQLTELGKNLTILTAPITAFGVTGLHAAGDFQSLMKQIELFGGVTGKQLDQVRSYLNQMGRDTVFSSSQSGEALLNLLKTGQSLEQGMETLPEVIKLATAGNLSLAQSSDLVTTAMAQYGISAKDTRKITDALAQGANASSADVGDLGEAMRNVGPIAKQYGLNFEQTTAILSLFANNGIKGAEAGTQLKSMLSQLYMPTKDNVAALKKLGISLYDNKGNVRDLNVVMKELDKAMSKLPVSKQNELIEALGGSYGKLGLSILRTNKGFDGMLTQMREAPGATAIAEGAAGTFNRMMQSLGGSIEVLQTSFLTPFMERTLQPLIKQVIDFVNSLAQWAEQNPELANTIATVAAGVAAFGAALFAAGPILGAIGGVITVLTTTILGPLIAIVGALALAWQSNFMGIRDAVLPALKSIQEGLSWILMAVGHFVSDIETYGVFDAILGLFGAGKSGAEADGQSLLVGIVRTLTTMLQDAGIAIAKVIDNILVAIGLQGPGAQAAQNAVKTFFGNIWAYWNDFEKSVENFGKVLEFFWTTQAQPNLQKLADWFTTTAMPAVISFIQTQVIPAVQGFINELVRIWNAISPGLTELFNWFMTNGLPAIVGFIQTNVTPILDTWINMLKNIWQAVSPALSELYNWFVTTGIPQIGNIIKNFSNVFLFPLISLLSGIWTAVQPGLLALVNGAKPIFDAIGVFIKGVVDLIKEMIAAIDRGMQAWANFKNSVTVDRGSLPGGKTMLESVLPGFQNPFVRDEGGRGKAGQTYLIGKGAMPEAFVSDTPGSNGTYIPNFDKVLSSMAGAGNPGTTISIGSLTIQANSRAEGRAAADGFAEKIEELRNRRGQ